MSDPFSNAEAFDAALDEATSDLIGELDAFQQRALLLEREKAAAIAACKARCMRAVTYLDDRAIRELSPMPDEPEPPDTLRNATHALIGELVAIADPSDRAQLTMATWDHVTRAVSQSLMEPTRQ